MKSSSKKIGLLMSQARGDLSQDYMAQALGVSRSTIRAWESGKTMPTLDKVFDWFNAAGKSVVPALLRYLYPELFTGDMESDAACRKLLHEWMENASPEERRALAYLMSCEWGGSFVALLQLMLAHAGCTMRSRVSHAAIIQHSYSLDGQNSPVQPDLVILGNAYHHATNAVHSGADSYVGGMPNA